MEDVKEGEGVDVARKGKGWTWRGFHILLSVDYEINAAWFERRM
jgi:hypothetical protein